jgi:DnaJ-class molecular chaperone
VSIPRRLWRIARNYAESRGLGEIGERAADYLSDAARELEEFLGGSRTPPSPPPPPPPPREHPLAAHYRTLGVPVGSDLETVERAWRRLVLATHPDRFMHDPARQKEASARLREINAAHEALEAALSPRASRPA